MPTDFDALKAAQRARRTAAAPAEHGADWHNPHARKLPDPMPELPDDVDVAIGFSNGKGKPGEWDRVLVHTHEQQELDL